MILEKNPSSITNSIFGDRLLFGKCKIYENDRSKIIIIFIIIGWIFFSIPAFAASDLNNNVDRKTIRICELEQCLDKEATSSIIYDLINSTLLESTGKSFKTCEYSIKDNKCIQSFISFEGKGVNIFKGRGGFVGFKINDAVKNGIENIVVDIDNYPWKMGSNLNEENVERFSNQQCDSNPLSLEVSEEGFFLAIREYSCKGSVYTFTKNLILKVEEINLKSGIVIFSYYIDIQGGATGSGKGFTKLDFGLIANKVANNMDLSNLLFASVLKDETNTLNESNVNRVESDEIINHLNSVASEIPFKKDVEKPLFNQDQTFRKSHEVGTDANVIPKIVISKPQSLKKEEQSKILVVNEESSIEEESVDISIDNVQIDGSKPNLPLGPTIKNPFDF